MSNRFDRLFDAVDKYLHPFMKDYEHRNLVFCYSVDHEEKKAKLSIYENFSSVTDFASVKVPEFLTVVEPGADLCLRSKLWFFNGIGQQRTNGANFEAHVEYFGEYRPNILVDLRKPLLELNIGGMIHVGGMTNEEDCIAL